MMIFIRVLLHTQKESSNPGETREQDSAHEISPNMKSIEQ